MYRVAYKRSRKSSAFRIFIRIVFTFKFASCPCSKYS